MTQTETAGDSSVPWLACPATFVPQVCVCVCTRAELPAGSPTTPVHLCPK